MRAVDRLRRVRRVQAVAGDLDGRTFVRDGRFRGQVQPSFLQYVRPDEEIAAVFGEAALAEARVNPDGTLDFTRWARPQNDGPAIGSSRSRAGATAKPDLERASQASMLELAVSDLNFIRTRAREPSFDIWEEERGYHYFTQLVQAEALARGAEWLERAGDACPRGRLPRRCR